MKTIKRFIFVIMAIVIASGAVYLRSCHGKYLKLVEEKPLSEAVSEIRQKENYTDIDDIRQIYINAVVAAEDKRFFKHNGFDVIGTARAMWKNIRAKKLEQGGSSITQQLAKNMYFPNMEHTFERKLIELFISKDLEEDYEKREILELYINGIYYGSGYYSIYDAAMGYFNKTPDKLSDFECTLLAGIPNAPSVYSLNVNPDLAYKRQEYVIECMVECGYLDEKNEILNDK